MKDDLDISIEPELKKELIALAKENEYTSLKRFTKELIRVWKKHPKPKKLR